MFQIAIVPSANKTSVLPRDGHTIQWSPSNQDEHTGRGLVDDYTRASQAATLPDLYMCETMIPYQVLECLCS